MPVEIKELVIRAVIEPRAKPATVPPLASPSLGRDHDAIVAACVKETLRRLDRSRER